MTATTEPQTFNAGERLLWEKTLDDYPASTWTLQYTLINSAGAYSFLATADGDKHAVDVASATTGTWTIGRYNWTSFVTDGTNKHTVDSGVFLIGADPASVTASDSRTHARKMLDAIEARIEGRATNGDLEVIKSTIADYSADMPAEKLFSWRDRYRAEVRREEMGGGVGVVKVTHR